MKQVKEIIERNNAKIEWENNPQHYFMQLVDTSDNLSIVKKKS